ncbi:MAG: Gfo/Idh/MocA family oxidoreductase, partial [Cytophagia bacterium]|nr:Gfo/Idh/MocA family oxidoreductase [Cytophagia bacterium]
MNKRDFLKSAALLTTASVLPTSVWAMGKADKLRTAHIGVGGMGMEDLKAISSHSAVDVVALCDVDANNLAAALKLHPNAKTYSDYRNMLNEMSRGIDAVVVSTPDH